MKEYNQNQIKELERKADEIRNLTLRMCIGGGTGHVTSSFSCAEILTTLYRGKVLNYDSKNPGWDGRDRFILSKGQASPILYATLADAGFFPRSWIDNFNKKNGPFGVHLQCDVPGVEYTTGSLGHGLGLGVGVALAAKRDNKNYQTVVLLGDAELQEGSCWESAMLASTLKLNNLTGIVDRNGYGVLCKTEQAAALDPLDKKFEAFGWDVRTINGHSITEIYNSLDDMRNIQNKKPIMVIANTTKGKGFPYWENVALRHGTAPRGDEVDRAKKETTENCGRCDSDICPLYDSTDLDKWRCPASEE